MTSLEKIILKPITKALEEINDYCNEAYQGTELSAQFNCALALIKRTIKKTIKELEWTKKC